MNFLKKIAIMESLKPTPFNGRNICLFSLTVITEAAMGLILDESVLTDPAPSKHYWSYLKDKINSPCYIAQSWFHEM